MPVVLQSERKYWEQLRRVHEAEAALVEQHEKVAEMRRALPSGPEVPDYVFQEGPAQLELDGPIRDVRLSELFPATMSYLIVDHFMWAPDNPAPCPMCSLWADGYDAVAHHVADRAGFVLVAKVDIHRLRAGARQYGWTRLRLLSSLGSDFNRDLGMEDEGGSQYGGISVFSRDPDGRVRLAYSAESPFRRRRTLDFYNPVWNLFDLLPGGRGDWMPAGR